MPGARYTLDCQNCRRGWRLIDMTGNFGFSGYSGFSGLSG
jgi:hypothetical protein